MTMRTYTYFICPNGHRGEEKFSENDQPYSKMWESVQRTGVEVVRKSANERVTYLCTECGLTMMTCGKP